MQYLKADTNVEILLGPAVAVGDGFTPVTTLTLSGADEAEIIKNNGATALVVTSISANTIAAITGADGYYTVDVTTGNVDTEGPLTILVNQDNLILPIRQDYMVVNANVYDSMFAASGTDVLDVSVTQVNGAAQTATLDTIKAETVLIVGDTSELQSDDYPTSIAALQTDLDTLTAGVTLAAGAITDASLAGNMEIVFETDFATNYNTTRNAWVTNFTDFIGTDPPTAAEINTEVDNAIITYGLDHLVAVADADDVVDNSIMAKLASATADWSTFDPAIESLEGLEKRIGNIASTGAAFHAAANANTTVADSGVETNTYTSTEHRDGVLHSVAEGTTDVDVYYEFDVGSTGLAVEVEWSAYLQGNNDTMVVQAWDWVAPGWETISNLLGSAGTTLETEIEALFAKHTGTGGDIGKVRIRFYNTGQASEIFVDQIFVAYAEAIGADIASILADTDELQGDWVDGGRLDAIQDIIAADTTTDIPALIATAQTDLDTISDGIITGTAATGTLSTTVCTSSLTGYTDDQMIGRIITFLAGPADGESSDITDYASTGGTITFTALTLAPEDGNAFKIT